MRIPSRPWPKTPTQISKCPTLQMHALYRCRTERNMHVHASMPKLAPNVRYTHCVQCLNRECGVLTRRRPSCARAAGWPHPQIQTRGPPLPVRMHACMHACMRGLRQLTYYRDELDSNKEVLIRHQSHGTPQDEQESVLTRAHVSRATPKSTQGVGTTLKTVQAGSTHESISSDRGCKSSTWMQIGARPAYACSQL